jgi:hypothetical protein
MGVDIVPSPSANIALRHYREEDRATFRFLSDALPGNSPIQRIADDPGAYSTAIVFENRSDREITALRYCWSICDNNGKIRTRTVGNDSYKVDVYRPVALPQSKQLLSVSGRLDVDQSLYDHVLAGGGLMGAEGSAGELPQSKFGSPSPDPVQSPREAVATAHPLGKHVPHPADTTKRNGAKHYVQQNHPHRPLAEFFGLLAVVLVATGCTERWHIA